MKKFLFFMIASIALGCSTKALIAGETPTPSSAGQYIDDYKPVEVSFYIYIKSDGS